MTEKHAESAPHAHVETIETLAKNLLGRLPSEQSGETKWRLEQPSRGLVFSIRQPQWRFSDSGNFKVTATSEQGTPFEFSMAENAYTKFMELPVATEGMDDKDYMHYLTATALKIGAYQSLGTQLKGHRLLKNDALTTQFTETLATIQKSVEARIQNDMDAIGKEHISLAVEQFRELIDYTHESYNEGMNMTFSSKRGIV